jgi:hypothetical protein
MPNALICRSDALSECFSRIERISSAKTATNRNPTDWPELCRLYGPVQPVQKKSTCHPALPNRVCERPPAGRFAPAAVPLRKGDTLFRLIGSAKVQQCHPYEGDTAFRLIESDG